MEVQSALNDITEQWSILFASRMLQTIQMSPSELSSRVESIASRQSNASVANALKKGLRRSE